MADPSDIVDALESLALHCRAPLMSVDDRSRWMRDWCDDLRSFDIAAIRSATARWRKGDSSKFPTPGQLLPLVRNAVAPTGAGQQGRKAMPWRAPTDAEYDAMSLSEKRDTHINLAHEARDKAGPMWSKTLGGPLTPDQLPERWHIWTKRAQNHEAEISRLRKILNEARERRKEELGAA